MATHQISRGAIASSSNFTSSPSTQSLKQYDVFLSFRGEDTRNNFTSHLHHALVQKQVKTYIDCELQRGNEIKPELMKAIEESHLSIIIFSENYASSRWCLEELSKIMECKECQGQILIPVFYKIEPTNVRHQSGSYQHAFANHEGDMRVAKWKAALEKAGNLAGFAWKNSETNRTEANFINEIVGDVLEKLKPKYPTELKALVGIERSYAEVKSLLKIGSNEGVRAIGIWGMGGIGKTTLAKALYVKLASSFDGHCFLANVRERSFRIGLDVLRNELYTELFGDKNLKLNTPELVSGLVETRLRRKKVFIVLDDVDTLVQLKNLIKDYDCLGRGSRVIVTSRNQDVLRDHYIFEVEQLNHHDSLWLFCANAFKEKHPKHGYEELSERVIAYCKGIPLALEVLGSHFHGEGKEVWEDELKKLKTIPKREIQEMLRLSYDSLEYTQKSIFLDIACFHKGEDKDRVANILEACGFFPTSGIPCLMKRALITISYDNKIGMHDLIQEMGQAIVRQDSITHTFINDPGKRSRLFDPEEVLDVLEHNKGTKAIEGMALNLSEIQSLRLKFDSFEKMIDLRYLHFYEGNSKNTSNVYIPEKLLLSFVKLRSFYWSGYCAKTLPSIDSAKMLVEFCMFNSNLEKLWDGVLSFNNLKTFNLRGSRDLVEVPDLSMAPNLYEIDLSDCERLREVHPSIFSLPNLRFLYLYCCKQIESLKTHIHSKSLKELLLDGCSSLHQFSVTSDEMEILSLRSTTIHELPSSFWQNWKLGILNLNDCSNLSVVGKNLVNDVGMGSLDKLDLSGCKQLNASGLEFLLGGVRSLTWLCLSKCYNIGALPDIIKNLSKLVQLLIDDCTKLEYVPELPPSLEWFSAKNCTSLKIVINLSSDEFVDDLKCLKELYLSNWCHLQILPQRISLLSSLRKLELSRSNIEFIELSNLPPSLVYLYASDCKSLKTVSNFNTSVKIELLELYLSCCCNLEELPGSIKNLSKLRVLCLDACRKLKGLPKLPSSLQRLHAVNCTSLDLNSAHRQLQEHIEHHILYSMKYWEPHSFILFPGDHVPDWFIHTTGTSITIPNLSLCNLRGFIYCIIPSKSISEIRSPWVWVYCHSPWVRGRALVSKNSFISDHLMLWYVDLKDLFSSEVNDLCMKVSFEFKIQDFEDDDITREGIKGCGVFPFYSTDLEWRRESMSRNRLKWESELEVGGSTEDMQDLLLDTYFTDKCFSAECFSISAELEDLIFEWGAITKDVVELNSNDQSSHMQEPLSLTDDLNLDFHP